jgi:hypothetical protein
MTQAEWISFRDTILAHPERKAHSATEFSSPKTFVCHPMDQVDFQDFKTWEGSVDADTMGGTWAVWPSSTPQRRPMSTLFIFVAGPSVAQSYTFSARAAFYLRYPLDSVPGQAMRPIPTGSISTINSHHQAAMALKDHAR